MAKVRSFAAIDVGTTKVCALVGELSGSGEVQIDGVGVAPSRGLRRGMVINIDEATESIRAAVERAERSSGTKILSAYVGITGSHISSLNNRGVIAITRDDRLISHDDVMRVLEAAQAIHIPNNREVLHVIPRSYTLDGQDGVKNPVGMHGFRLDVETHIVTGSVTAIQNLTKCVEPLGIQLEDLVLEPLASSEAVLTEEEKEMGVVLADIGGGTTDIAVFIEGSIWHTSVLPVGGNHFTNDIAIGLRMPFAAAEELKIKYGHAQPGEVDPEESLEVTAFGGDGERNVLRRHLSEIIRARAEELAEMILVDMKRSGYEALLPAGLVLTGGTANLCGIAPASAHILQWPVRVGTPRGVTGLVDTVSNPAYATSIGLLLWGLKQGEEGDKERQLGFGIQELTKRFGSWLRELVP